MSRKWWYEWRPWMWWLGFRENDGYHSDIPLSPSIRFRNWWRRRVDRTTNHRSGGRMTDHPISLKSAVCDRCGGTGVAYDREADETYPCRCGSHWADEMCR